MNTLPPIAPIDSIAEPGQVALAIAALFALAICHACLRRPRRRGWVYWSGGSGPVSDTERFLRGVCFVGFAALMLVILGRIIAISL